MSRRREEEEEGVGVSTETQLARVSCQAEEESDILGFEVWLLLLLLPPRQTDTMIATTTTATTSTTCHCSDKTFSPTHCSSLILPPLSLLLSGKSRYISQSVCPVHLAICLSVCLRGSKSERERETE